MPSTSPRAPERWQSSTPSESRERRSDVPGVPVSRFQGMPQLLVADLGTMPYAAALELQRAAARARISGAIAEDLLLLVEHPPVVTMGRSAKQHHLLASPALLATRGVELFEVERGGDVTFH